MNKDKEVFVTSCCSKEVEWEEYFLNHSLCDEHMAEAFKKFEATSLPE